MEPISYRDALNHHYSLQWKAAMKEEFQALDRNRTWDLVDEATVLQSGKRVIGSKWVYRMKRNADGSNRYKARLVIKGYEQEYGIDYQETFAPVAKFVTIRILFALAAQFNWEIEQMDAITAFLNPILHEEVYMEQPEGFEVASASGGRLVCRLLKSLYGLKQAPRAWYTDINTFLLSLGLTRSKEDYNLYISVKANIILLLFVDDILLFSPSIDAIKSIKSQLTAKYQMTDLGPARQFLGIQIERNRQARTLRIHQKPYIESILKRFQMENCNGVSTPMDPNLELIATPINYTATLQQKLDYQQSNGSIMYAMLGTRPDLAFSISTLSKFCSNPTPDHALAINRALRYLNKTIDVGITYGGYQNPAIEEAIKHDQASRNGLIGLFGFTDSDWAGDKDSRKSTSGFLFTLYGGAISWKSTKQSVVATSSTEAEYIACSEAAKEALWIRRMLKEICGEPTQNPMEYSHEFDSQIKSETGSLYNSISMLTDANIHLSGPQGNFSAETQPTEPQIIFADNQGAIKLSRNPQHHKRTKHIDVRYHFIRESTQSGLIRLVHIPTNEMVADILTKALPRLQHQKHMKGMGMDSVGVA
jgi:hypothetical protein